MAGKGAQAESLPSSFDILPPIPIAYYKVPAFGDGEKRGVSLRPDMSLKGMESGFTYSKDKKNCFVFVCSANQTTLDYIKSKGPEITKAEAEAGGGK